ncbi:MAG: PucR family transcriptional regulator ligand-binding domain-containing protein [bacterium]|nr:PucR family transcriptional regulator ligand-binding domain-containing protein [bacterium]
MRDVLELPELAASNVLAGDAGLDRDVRGVTILDAPDGIRYIRGGEFMFTTLFHYRNAGEQIALIRELNEREAAGLGVKLQRFVDSLEPEVIHAANELAFPVVQVPYALAWVDVINSALKELLGRKTRELERSWTIQRHFISLALEQGSIEILARELAGLVNRPLVIVNGFTGTRASVDFPELPRPWQPGSDETATPLPERPALARIKSPRACSCRVVCRVGNDRSVDGWVIVQDRNGDLTTEDLVAIEQAAVAVALDVQKVRAVSHMERSVKDDFVHHLLAGDFESEVSVAASARALGWEPAPSYAAVVFRVDRLPSTWADARDYRVGWRVLDLLAGGGLPRHSITEVGYQERPIALIPTGEAGVRERADLQVAARVAGIIEDLGRRHQGLHLTAGVGRPRMGVLAVKDSYREAAMAVELAPVIPGAGPVVLFRDLGLYRLVADPTDPEVAGFIRDTIGPILKYDREQPADLTRTLAAFLDHGASYREAAKILHVHHNTVRYRLSQVEKMTAMDLGSPQDRFNLHLATRLWLASSLAAETKQRAEDS